MERVQTGPTLAGTGILLVALGVVTTPGLGGRTVIACRTYGTPAFRGVRLSDLVVVWYDGCNVWTFSLAAAVGGLLLVGALAVGCRTLVRTVRNPDPGGTRK